MERCGNCGHQRRDHWLKKWGVHEVCHRETQKVQPFVNGPAPMPTIREYTRCKCRSFVAAERSHTS
jgi:hypothetical protein